MKVAFYITAITDFQDMLPIMVESVKRNHDCWIAILDCLSQKRQFYFYEKKDLVDSLKNFFTTNNLDIPIIEFYGQKQSDDFNNDYTEYQPDVVYVQNITHKYPSWIPKADKSMVVSFAWHHDSVNHFRKSIYDIALNVVRRSDEMKYFSSNMPNWLRATLDKREFEQVCNVNTKYFGNLRLESLNFAPSINPELAVIPKKSCLLIETQVRKGSDRIDSVAQLADKMILKLRQHGYKIFWKRREKGYPVKNPSVLDYCENQPDVIIDRDLNFPSAMVFLAKYCNVCFTLQTSTSYWDLKKINENSAMLIPSPAGSREPRVIKNYYGNGDNEVDLKIINMADGNSWQEIDAMLQTVNVSVEKKYDKKQPSLLILDEVQKIWSTR